MPPQKIVSLTDEEKIRYVNMMRQIKRRVVCLEILRQQILKALQQKKTIVQPHSKLAMLEKKIRLAMTSQWDIETILSQEGIIV